METTLNEDGYSSSPLLHQSSSRRNSFSSTIHAPSTSLLHLPTLEEIDRRTASSGKRYLDDAETAGTPGGPQQREGCAESQKISFTVSTGKAGSASASGGETEATAAVNKVYYDYLSDSEYEFECAGFANYTRTRSGTRWVTGSSDAPQASQKDKTGIFHRRTSDV